MQPYSSLPLDDYPSNTLSRRPWSPIHDSNTNRYQREASEPSFEALDLADYAATLRDRNDALRVFPPEASSLPCTHHTETRFHLDQPSTPQTTSFLSSRTPIRSPPTPLSVHDSPLRSQSHLSRSTFPNGSPLRQSLPSYTSGAPWSATNGYLSSDRSMPGKYDVGSEAVDMADFPTWSRPWFNKGVLQHDQSHFPTAGTPSLTSHYGSLVPGSDAYSHRKLLPWTGEAEASSPYVSPEVKEARMRALHEEFGKDVGPIEDEGNPIGGIDKKGGLVTDGPRKRAFARVSQGLLALGVFIASLYAAIILKPKEPPPPRGSAASYLLYILSILTFLTMSYMFLFRPCCCSGRQKQTGFAEGLGGMRVLPVQSLPGPGRKGKKGKKDKKKGTVGEGVQVNLIVDPSSFGQREDTYGDGGDDLSQSDVRTKHPPRRIGVFEGLRKEEQWRTARSQLKRLFAFDIALTILWAVEFVLILLGRRCPAGKFDGWCDSYNTATALACFLVLAFSFSVYFDIKDLHASKASPRTRT